MGKREIHVYTIHGIGTLLPEPLPAPEEQPNKDKSNPAKKGEENGRVCQTQIPP